MGFEGSTLLPTSEMFKGLQAGRNVALVPAEPKERQEVEAFALLSANSPQEEWRPIGKRLGALPLDRLDQLLS